MTGKYKTKTVAVAMSGGVDSSVAAALLLKKGFKVIGLTMKLFSSSTAHSSTGCCADEALDSARRIAAKIGIEHRVVDCQKEFEQSVIDNFISEYSRARTPNPCVTCNKIIKFGSLLNLAKEMGCDHLATGHYAQIRKKKGRHILARAKDISKDQSYFLWTLSQKQLRSVIFPLGSYPKQVVRELADSMGIESFNKPESQEICFIPKGHYSEYLSQRKAFPAGEIVDINGKVLGKHNGIVKYTIGQREGLGIALGKAQYVIDLDYSSNLVIVGDDSLLFRNSITATNVNWFINQPRRQIKATVKIRNQHKGSLALIKAIDEETAQITFVEKQRAITPGQSAVFYQGELVLGGGLIK